MAHVDSNMEDAKNKSHNESEDMSWSVIKSYYTGQHLTRCVRFVLLSQFNYLCCCFSSSIILFPQVETVSEKDRDWSFIGSRPRKMPLKSRSDALSLQI